MDCIALQVPLSMGFPWQEYPGGLPFPTQKGSSQPRELSSKHLHNWIFCFMKQCFEKLLTVSRVFPGYLASKESACNAGDLGLIPWLGRSPGEGNGYPLQYSCLENPHG